MEGFSPELALVTVGGGKELEEKLVVSVCQPGLTETAYLILGIITCAFHG